MKYMKSNATGQVYLVPFDDLYNKMLEISNWVPTDRATYENWCKANHMSPLPEDRKLPADLAAYLGIKQ